MSSDEQTTYVQRNINSKKYVIHSFDTFGEYLREVQLPVYHDNARYGSRSPDSSFCETKTYEEAIDLAKFGWKKGRELMVDKVRELALLPQLEVAPRFFYDVSGMYPEVPLAVSGDPACMVNRGDVIVAQKRVFKIVCNMSITWHTSREAIINRGVALLSYIDYMELQGYSVELTFLSTSEAGSYSHYVMYPVKRIGEHVDIDRMSFCLAHPSSLRRLGFALVEQVRDEEFWSRYCSGYGRVMDPSKEELVSLCENDIYVPSMLSSTGYSSLKDALDTVGKLMEKTYTRKEE